MRIVTSGETYTDIDGFAGCVAYAALLRLQGVDAIAVLPGPLNESITPEIRSWNVAYETSYTPHGFDDFVLIDISEPEFIAYFVDPARVVEVIDHHPGDVRIWLHYGAKLQIEHVGAACTQVFERWQHAGQESQMPTAIAKLLACGILDNTLNFNAAITNDRDRAAYQTLQGIGGFDTSLAGEYFTACQATMMANLETALSNDVKTVLLLGYPEQIMIGQLVMWDASEAVQRKAALAQVMRTYNKPWFINLVSISEGKNYLVCDNQRLEVYLMQLLDTEFDDGVAHTSRLWLRKEILKQAIDVYGGQR